ncbi:MAG: Smr/MutS family protein [Gemmatimonadales bacterium]|nr:Smr/MutS family protein [Gemmatimonadales bacterium]
MSPRRGKHPSFDASDDLLDARPVASLDLHGFTASEAPAAVRSFVQSWSRRSRGAVVHIITGKGTVLRPVVKTLLQGELRSLVAKWGLDDAEGGYMVRVR